MKLQIQSIIERHILTVQKHKENIITKTVTGKFTNTYDIRSVD